MPPGALERQLSDKELLCIKKAEKNTLSVFELGILLGCAVNNLFRVQNTNKSKNHFELFYDQVLFRMGWEQTASAG